jgi:hypothetical protein
MLLSEAIPHLRRLLEHILVLHAQYCMTSANPVFQWSWTDRASLTIAQLDPFLADASSTIFPANTNDRYPSVIVLTGQHLYEVQSIGPGRRIP